MPKHNISGQSSQGGAALIVALIMLILVSLLAAGGYFLATSEARAAAGWSDRHRAMFLAEGALKEAESAVREGVATAVNIQSAVRNKNKIFGKGYYIRGEVGVPVVDAAWSGADKGIKATAVDSRAADAYYMVVYEGEALQSGTQYGSGVSSRPRFTLYAQAGGIKEKTLVVLSMSQEF